LLTSATWIICIIVGSTDGQTLIQQERKLAFEVTTHEAAQALGVSVATVQKMADRGELPNVKTSGGHRRISRSAVRAFLGDRLDPHGQTTAGWDRSDFGRVSTLLIDDSVWIQHSVERSVHQNSRHIDLQVAPDVLNGLVLLGRLLPRVLIVDVVTPGVRDGFLIDALRCDGLLSQVDIIVLTQLDATRLEGFTSTRGLVVVDKRRLDAELPRALERWLPTGLSSHVHSVGTHTLPIRSTPASNRSASG
jgi:excisionase family DNA binding protein